MAAIPTIIYLGSETITGTTATVTPQPGYPLTAGLPLSPADLFLTGLGDPKLTLDVGNDSTAKVWWDGKSGTPGSEGANATTGQFVVAASPSPTTTTFTLTGAAFAGDLTGKKVYFDETSNAALAPAGLERTIASHTATAITITPALPVAPSAGDVMHIATGAWRRYNPVRSGYNPTIGQNKGTLGDNWFQSTPGNFGPSIKLMERLNELYPTSPYFRVFKQAFDTGIAQMVTGGTAWTSFVAEWDKAELAYDADTADIKGIVLDFAHEDIQLDNESYFGQLFLVLTQIRAKFGTTVPIFLVNPHAEIGNVSHLYSVGGGPLAETVRQWTRVMANTDPGDGSDDYVRLIDANALNPALLTDATGYDVPSVLTHGVQIANAIEAYHAAAPTVAPGTGIATYIMLGDSQAVGQIELNFIVAEGSEELLGPSPGTVRQDQWVYNGDNETIELYDVTANDNANGAPASGYAGPSCTFLARLAEEHPNGVLLLKVAQGGASLTVEGQDDIGIESFDITLTDSLWSDTKTWWSEVIAKVYSQLSRTLDVRGVAALLGDNDVMSSTAAAAFATKLADTVAAWRETFQTRSEGSLSVAMQEIPKHVDEGGYSTRGTFADRSTVRAAVAQLATTDAKFAVSADTGFRLKRDNIHWSGEANLQIGRQLAETLIALNSDEGETDTTTSTLSSSAAFTVEAGSGATDANSYATVAFGDSYFATRSNPATWTGATTIEKQNALREGTAYLDDVHGGSWRGTVLTLTQALTWPRMGAVDSDSNLQYNSDVIPRRLQEACAELAIRHLSGISLRPDLAAGTDNISSSSFSIGPISVSESFAGQQGTHPRFPIVESKLRGLLSYSSSKSMVRITR